MAREVDPVTKLLLDKKLPQGMDHDVFMWFLERFEALVRADERERICKAIKEEDDYCVTEGDYMLDSDDCIAVTKGVWVRPEFNLEPIRARGKT
jgi:hypothetical protein